VSFGVDEFGAVLPGGIVRADTLKMNFIFKMADAILTLHAAEAYR
jgi:hypothetical protein